ncbi:HDOD domain-containing protein [Rossellomorea vietnamensis]|uniref:HDOD domain-containing protein n=1 Tax=Rossellomorea vietnamensis TaxID=218284 RepID=A0A5D4KHB0_9BACI|nr:HDOD domain-containing protein [Rossellomorea vietnamensis]TYR76608.1 HDOD domain-containing protein [Rossellomorea vietnamensis]
MEVFVARQPIFNASEEAIAYELLYRNNQENFFPNIDGDRATADVIINSFLNIGIDQLSGGKPCFINFTETLLKLKVPTYFRPREIVIEILETVKPSPEIIKICRELRKLGYKIALDDFVFDKENPYCKELMKLADYIKVDMLAATEKKREEIELIARLLDIKLLAEKVETRRDFEEAKKRGYTLFQGFFFSKPVILSTYDVPVYFHSYYEVIQRLEMSEPNMERIAELIEQDLSLSYKLLKLINSPAYRPKHKINSIRQAIILLGLIEIQRWIYVLAIRDMTGSDRQISDEVIKLCLTRAKMCELISTKLSEEAVPSSFFLTGMFSLMEDIIGQPIGKVLKDMPLQDDICDALRGKQNNLKKVLDLVIAIEQADWERAGSPELDINITQNEYNQFYIHSCQWAEGLLRAEYLQGETLKSKVDQL